MKKLIIAILCVLLLVGCAQPEATIPTGIDKWPVDQSGFSNYINISNENVWDLCPTMDTQLQYLFLSKEPLTSDNGPMLVFTNACEYTDEEVEDGWATEFPFWLYQTYRGVDWNEVSRLAEVAQRGDEKAALAIKEYENLYLEDYQALTPADLPQIHGYWITNNVTAVDNDTSARYEKVRMLLGEEEITLDVGLLDLYNKGWDQYLTSEDVEDVYNGRLAAACPTYWGDGKVTLTPIEVPMAEQGQTWNMLELYGINGEILDIQVNYGDNTQSWDGNSPLEIPAQTGAVLIVTLQTDANKIVGYCEDANICLSKTENGKTQRLWYFASIAQSWNIYELYALTVDKLDIGAYYTYTSQWHQPEKQEAEKSEKIDFDDITIAEFEPYSIKVTGASWDDFTYTLHISATNHTEELLEKSLTELYINGQSYGKIYNLALQAGEISDFSWHIPWESLKEYGINIASGTEIISLTIGYIAPEQTISYTDIYPYGESSIQCSVPQGVLVLETDTFRLYAASHGWQDCSILRNQISSQEYSLMLTLENLTEKRLNFRALEFSIDGLTTNGVAVDTLRSKNSSSNIICMSIEKSNVAKVDNAQTITFTLTVNNSETYPVTIDLTVVPKEE